MMCKNQLIVFVISFFVAGIFLLSTAELGFTGFADGVCCDVVGGPNQCSPTVGECENVGTPCEAVEACQGPGGCTCIEPIPTLSQWGKIITIAMIGLFAVIGVFAMRRRNALTS